MSHNTFGLTIPTVLDAIRNNRRLSAFWTGKGFPTIAETHKDNVRDLRIVLTQIRFPETPLTVASDFHPVIVVTPDNTNDTNDTNDNKESVTLSDSDRVALADAIADETEFATGEKVAVSA